jgi:D-aminopeptidase
VRLRGLGITIGYAMERGYYESFFLPVTAEHAVAAIEGAAGGPVAEGNVGGGTGMICHSFKGGIGTSSRVASTPAGDFTVGVLAQANYGLREDLRVDGEPVGRLISESKVPSGWEAQENSSSIIVIITTDAPLIPTQCRRLAQRATTG